MLNKKPRLLFSSKEKALNKLSNAEVQGLVDKYYDDTEKASDLVQEYGLRLRPNQLVKTFPIAIVNDRCPYDDENMVAKLEARSASTSDSPYNYSKMICPKCEHKVGGVEQCDCENCQERRQMQKDKRISSIAHLAVNIQGGERIDLSDISLKNRLYLSALLRGFLSEDESFIYGVRNKLDDDVILSPFIS